ncbi:MAG: dTMP kinase [Sulfolobaceae archaeon]
MPRTIVIEGIDGAGKTTVARKLYELLSNQNLKVILTSEPFTQEIIDLINKVQWKDPVALALLFSADRALHISWLKNQVYDIVIMDRYFYSTIAYQGAMGVDIKWLKCVNSIFPNPDIIFLLDIDPKIALGRIKENDIFNYKEKLSSLYKVRKIYLELAKEFKMHVIDASKPLDEVIKTIFEIVRKNILS